MFTPSRLTLARKRRGLTKAALAKAVEVDVRSVTAWEMGEFPPTNENICTLSEVLGFEASFFAAREVETLTLTPASFRENPSFRAASRMRAWQRDAALAAGEFALEVFGFIDTRFNLPKPQVPDLRHCQPEAAAQTLRQMWEIGERPIKNLVHLLETKGISVFSLVEECKEVDAFSFWRGNVPFIFLNTRKTPERSRFDAAHELGHLVLHQHGQPAGKEAESEADSFASAFLMPSADVLARVRANPSVDYLLAKKKIWRVSLSALARRCHSLGLLSSWNYYALCAEIGRRFGRQSEPEGISERETSLVLQKVMTHLWKMGITWEKISKELHLPVSEVNKLVFGLVQGSANSPDGATARKLQLVHTH